LVYPGNGKASRSAFIYPTARPDFNDQRLFAELRLMDDWRDLKFIQSLAGAF